MRRHRSVRVALGERTWATPKVPQVAGQPTGLEMPTMVQMSRAARPGMPG
jgi:hypothetical protein